MMRTGMIFAAGLGTRLRPLTDDRPKALVEICGHPLLWHVARRLVQSGCGRLVVNVHHFADQVERYLSEVDFGVPVDISDERAQLLDTGGGLLHARRFLDDGMGSPFLVHNVDIATDADLVAFSTALPSDALALLLVGERPSSRKLLFDEGMRLVGWMHEETGQVRGPAAGLPGADRVRHLRRLAFCGVHLLSPSVFSVMEGLGWPPRFSIVDFYLEVCARFPVVGHLPKGGVRCVDVGKFDQWAQCEKAYGDLCGMC